MPEGRAKKIQEVLNHDEVKIKEVHEIRWFAFYNALFAIYKSWKPLVVYFRQIKKKNEKEEEILKEQFVSTMHTLMDILPSFTQLSQVFQKQNLDVTVVRPALNGAQGAAKLARDGKGAFQKEFNDNLVKKLVKEKDKDGNLKDKPELHYKGEKVSGKMSEVNEIRNSFVDHLIENTDKRFPQQSTDIAFAFNSLGMRPLSFLSSEDFEEYGKEDIKRLGDFYGQRQTFKGKDEVVVSEAIVDPIELSTEWSTLKKLVLEQHYPRDSFRLLWKIIKQNHGESFPNLCKLAKLSLTIPLQTADCERGFSCQNNIHTAGRNRLKHDKLNKLMVVMIEGPDIGNFNFEKAVKIWSDKVNRKIFQKS